MTDKEKLVRLLEDFGITPIYEGVGWQEGCLVSLSAHDGGVDGYTGFSCDFTFDEEGKFVSVRVWE